LRSHIPRRAAQYVRGACGCFHHACKNLKRLSFSSSIWADQPTHLAGFHFKCDSTDGFEFSIAFRQAANIDGPRRGDSQPILDRSIRGSPVLPPLDLDWQ
jgi:hypothetical protein